MKQKWQKSRNYRRFKNENGEVVRRVITVDDIDVEVSEEWALPAKMDRKADEKTE